jgi:CDP-Glycerol:Poly(glycerophosphate) glycerophosphotransferase
MGLFEKAKFIFAYPDFPIKLAKLKSALKKLRGSGRQAWVFQCDYEGHYSYLKPFFEVSKDYDDVEIFFAIGYSKKQDNPKGFLINQGIPAENILDPVDYVALTDWDVYMSPTEWGNIFPKNKDALRVQIFHTLADKKIEYSKELLAFNIIFASGPVHHEFLEKYIFEPYPEGRKKCDVIDTGFAKIDELFDGTYARETLKAQFAIDPQDKRKIVLYAPNWEITSALNKYGESVFEVLSRSDYIVLIKLHYMSLISKGKNPLAGEVNWNKILDKYRNYENIRIVEEKNINPCMVLADLMVTDYGGASLEFICMDKPIVYLDCAEFFDLRGHDIFEKEARKTGDIIDDIAILPETIKNALASDPHIEARREMIKRLIYNPGTAARTGFSVLHDKREKKQTIHR